MLFPCIKMPLFELFGLREGSLVPDGEFLGEPLGEGSTVLKGFLLLISGKTGFELSYLSLF